MNEIPREHVDLYVVAKQQFERALSWMDDLKEGMIDYLINPIGGVGFKVYDTDQVSFVVDGGAGVVWEKNTGLDRDTSGTVNAGQSFAYRFSETAQFTQDLTALWKMNNFEDAFYHFGVALSTSIIQVLELKVEYILDFKNVTPSPEVKKTDTAFLTSILYRF